jgi:hypothetical protein
MGRFSILPVLVLVIVASLMISACNLASLFSGSKTPAPIATTNTSPTATVEVTPKIQQIKPGEPSTPSLEFKDTSVKLTAADKGALEGDLYYANLFERPFDTGMSYLPDVDIQKAAISSDNDFLYFTINLNGVNTQSGDLKGLYAVELDINKDGRGDYWIGALEPKGNDWVTSGVTVRFDANQDVGGTDPSQSDAPFSGNGYETIVPNDAAEAAWVRVSSTDPAVVQIAIHRKLLGNPFEFLWGVTADNSIKDPTQYDYDDKYTNVQAGSPYEAEKTLYPLKIVNSYDNVCRQAFGFVPTTRIPNMCFDAPKPDKTTPCSAYNRATCPLDRCKILLSTVGSAACVDK